MASIVRQLLCDPVVEESLFAPVGSEVLNRVEEGFAHLIYVLPRPGVMDPVAQSTQAAITDLGYRVEAVRTFRKYWVSLLGQRELGTALLEGASQ